MLEDNVERVAFISTICLAAGTLIFASKVPISKSKMS